MVVAARQHARDAGNDIISVGHLVLGLVAAPDGAAARAAAAQGVALQDVERTASATLPPAAAAVPTLIPFDEHAKDALQRAFAQASQLEADVIGSEHVLLGILAADHGTGVLAGLGVTFEVVQAHLRAGTE